jgi:hypothetical protein
MEDEFIQLVLAHMDSLSRKKVELNYAVETERIARDTSKKQKLKLKRKGPNVKNLKRKRGDLADHNCLPNPQNRQSPQNLRLSLERSRKETHEL